MSDEIKQFEKDCREEILIQGNSHDLKQKSIEWLNEANKHYRIKLQMTHADL